MNDFNLQQDRLVLRYPRHQRLGMTVLCATLLSIMVTPLFFFPVEDAEDIAGVSVLFGLFAVITVPSMLEFWGTRLVANDAGLHATSLWRANRFIPWADIERIDFSPTLQWFRLRTRSQGIVRLHVYLENVYALLSYLEDRGVAYPRVPHM